MIVLVIFLADRISKFYILKIAEVENMVDIYLTPYLNFYLIWNKGIAFGLLTFDESFVYNVISLIIIITIIVVLVMVIRTNGVRRYSLISILGGSIGYLFDRI